MRAIYTLIFYLALPFVYLRLLWRSRTIPGYRQRMRERLGVFSAPQHNHCIWLHTVSVGEVIAATPLIKQLQIQYPDYLIAVTTTTPTGSERLMATFKDSIFHVYLPYDIPGPIKRFLNNIKPNLFIIVETELWPNVLHYTYQAKIPILLANARLSNRSVQRYAYIKPVMQGMLENINLIAAQTQQDADNYQSLGMPNNKVLVTGSIKFDLDLPEDLDEKTQQLKAVLNHQGLIWCVASTHKGEEEIILKIFAEIKKQVPDLLLLLVPRHPDRFALVKSLCEQQNYKVVTRSSNQVCNADTDIFLGDSMGEMMTYYNVSDIVFVAGSLMPIGGHNLLEPAALSKAIITGAHMHNFTKIMQMLLDVNGLIQIKKPDELVKVVVELANDVNRKEQLGLHAKQVVDNNKGALQKHMQLINKFLIK